MNSETRSTLEEYAKQAGEIIDCRICPSFEVSSGDTDAESKAYAIATNAWKSGEFRMDSREEIMELMKSVLMDANHRCPTCDRDAD